MYRPLMGVTHRHDLSKTPSSAWMRGCLQWSNGVGLRDGAIVGGLGEVVGESVGAVVGDTDGLTVGDTDGLALGLALGLDVGASVLHLPSDVP